jgi:hypothetical protein
MYCLMYQERNYRRGEERRGDERSMNEVVTRGFTSFDFVSSFVVVVVVVVYDHLQT